jgi:predicted lipopolysaccharide heptosyltransferase III
LAAICRPDSPLAQVQRLLLVRLRSAGDILLLTPAAAALKAARPDLLIAVLVEERFTALLDGHPHFDAVLGVVKRRPLGRHLPTLARRLRRFEFDLALDLHGGWRAALYTLLSGARRRAGEARFRFSRSYHLPLTPTSCSARHTVEHNFELLSALGLQAAPGPLVPALPESAQKRGSVLISGAGIAPGQRYAVLQPTTNRASRRLEPEKFAEVARGLAHAGLAVLVSAGPGEQRQAAQVVEMARHHQVRAVYPRDLAELAGVLQKASLFVGNDSGPSHLAAALQLPTVVVFGSSDPQRWHPWTTRGAWLSRGLSCSPCRGHRCLRPAGERFLCLTEISAGAVLQTALGLLQARQVGLIQPMAQ